jgi:protease-4
LNAKKAGIILVTASILVTLLAVILTTPEGKEAKKTPTTSSGKIAVIYLTGVISNTEDNALLGTVSSTAQTMQDLEKAEKDSSLQAVVIRIDSPGGSASASHELYEQILRVKKSGKKVVASLGDMAASGGYYSAVAADKIVSVPSTITGSIGVISTVPNLEELYSKIGYRERVFKSGAHKDMLSPTRPLTPEEEKIMEGIIADTYDQFVEVVAKGRGLPQDRVRQLADGRIYTGSQAKELGLVDELGGKRDAIKLAAKLAGIKGEPKVVEYRRAPGLLSLLKGIAPSNSSELLPHPQPPAYTTLQY